MLNLRLLDEIDADTFATKSIELRDRIEDLKVSADNRRRAEDGEIA